MMEVIFLFFSLYLCYTHEKTFCNLIKKNVSIFSLRLHHVVEMWQKYVVLSVVFYVFILHQTIPIELNQQIRF